MDCTVCAKKRPISRRRLSWETPGLRQARPAIRFDSQVCASRTFLLRCRIVKMALLSTVRDALHHVDKWEPPAPISR